MLFMGIERIKRETGRRANLAVAILCGVAVLCVAGTAKTADWPEWRGPNFDGSSNETGLPSSVSVEKNVVWSAPMPGLSSATPAIWGKKLFVVSASADKTAMIALCFDTDTGKELWRKTLVENADIPPRNTRATCSPVTDGSLVVFMFGTSDMFGFDTAGRKLWSRNLVADGMPIDTKFGYSSSPFLFDGKLYVQILRFKKLTGGPKSIGTDEDSYLLCFDPKSGKLLWKVRRRSDATDEALDAYSTPTVWKHDGKTEILVVGADYVTSHDPGTGKELWRFQYNPKHAAKWRLVSSVTVAGDIICGMQPRRGLIYAVRPGSKTNMTFEDAAWTYTGETTDVTTPLYYRDRIYAVGDKSKYLTCLDPKTGRRVWEGELGGDSLFYASPTAADGKVYCLSQTGELVVCAAGDEFKVLSRCQLGGGKPTDASVAIADGKLFIRTAETLFCIDE